MEVILWQGRRGGAGVFLFGCLAPRRCSRGCVEAGAASAAGRRRDSSSSSIYYSSSLEAVLEALLALPVFQLLAHGLLCGLGRYAGCTCAPFE